MPKQKAENNIEYRAIDQIELRKDEDKPAVITGYAAVFDKLSLPLGFDGGFREKIAKGAFTKTIKKDDIRALVDHDPGKIIGRKKAGTLTLREDDKGLRVEITPPDTQVGRDIVTSIERGDVDGMSFGFRTITDEWHIEDKKEIRTLIEVDLSDVAPVTYPAYTSTTVAVRSLDEWKESQKPKDEGVAERMSMQLKLEESK